MSANSIYEILNFPSNDPFVSAAVQPFSANVQYQMNLMPSLVTTWQQNDIATSNTNGYFQNPAASITQNLLTASSNIINLTEDFYGGNSEAITTLLNNSLSIANNIVSNTGNNFLYHTNRLSNVVDLDENVDLPHYQTVIGFGKLLTYIVNKTDGVQNNSILIGGFSSILAANSFSANVSNTIYWVNQFPDTLYQDELGNTYSSMSLSNAQSMYTTLSSINNEMWNRRQQDIGFFNNTRSVIERYNNVSQFNNIGQTETDLIMNHIGTDKIKSRLNS